MSELTREEIKTLVEAVLEREYEHAAYVGVEAVVREEPEALAFALGLMGGFLERGRIDGYMTPGFERRMRQAFAVLGARLAALNLAEEREGAK